MDAVYMRTPLIFPCTASGVEHKNGLLIMGGYKRFSFKWIYLVYYFVPGPHFVTTVHEFINSVLGTRCLVDYVIEIFWQWLGDKNYSDESLPFGNIFTSSQVSQVPIKKVFQ